MRRIVLAVLVSAMILVTAVGCVRGGLGVGEVVASGAPGKGDAQTVSDLRLGDAVTAFGLDLLRESSAVEAGNVVVSPLSAHAALAMTYNGASGETAKQMERVLRLGELDLDATNIAYANLLASLAGVPDSGTELSIANSLWIDDSFKLFAEFAATDRDFYGAQLEGLDLQGDGARERINGWVAERTGDKITDLVDQIPDLAVIYLVNAVYLNGEVGGSVRSGVNGGSRLLRRHELAGRRADDAPHGEVLVRGGRRGAGDTAPIWGRSARDVGRAAAAHQR